ncbi:DUF4144 family protein [Shewanella sp. UCD-KL12]|uniref:DUF4144 family protein n=1 Tax=Shewanella sp. UCD-KL12 TaxID=1917163 RepID=UPI000970EB5C|nr:DUF4144 family protein [Shewanella sp. UCD-KL12]
MNYEVNEQITWPAVIIHKGQAELLYLASNEDWLEQAQGHIEANANLLDSTGSLYRFNQNHWQLSTEVISQADLIERVRQHASTLGHCCTAKLGADTLKQIFEIIKYLEEN